MMNTNTMLTELTEAQTLELRRLKSFYPYRIVYGAFNPQTNEWLASAVFNMRIPNKLAREGWQVFTLRVSKTRL